MNKWIFFISMHAKLFKICLQIRVFFICTFIFRSLISLSKWTLLKFFLARFPFEKKSSLKKKVHVPVTIIYGFLLMFSKLVLLQSLYVVHKGQWGFFSQDTGFNQCTWTRNYKRNTLEYSNLTNCHNEVLCMFIKVLFYLK